MSLPSPSPGPGGEAVPYPSPFAPRTGEGSGATDREWWKEELSLEAQPRGSVGDFEAHDSSSGIELRAGAPGPTACHPPPDLPFSPSPPPRITPEPAAEGGREANPSHKPPDNVWRSSWQPPHSAALPPPRRPPPPGRVLRARWPRNPRGEPPELDWTSNGGSGAGGKRGRSVGGREDTLSLSPIPSPPSLSSQFRGKPSLSLSTLSLSGSHPLSLSLSRGV